MKSSLGGFSGLIAHLRIRREIPYYLTAVYLPISLLVIGSWLSFWLDVYAVPARITLGITTILTIITSSRGIKESIPRVSYLKAVDVWIETCTWFVFCALLEFPFVNFIARKGRETDSLAASAAQNANTRVPACNKLFQVVRQPTSMNKVSLAITNGPPIRQFGDCIGTDRTQPEEYFTPEDPCANIFPKVTEQTAKSVDRVCRIIFPCAFVIFNLIYWLTWAP